MEPIVSPIQREDTLIGFEEDFVILCDKYGINSYHLIFSEKVGNDISHFRAIASAMNQETVEIIVELAEELRDSI